MKSDNVAAEQLYTASAANRNLPISAGSGSIEEGTAINILNYYAGYKR